MNQPNIYEPIRATVEEVIQETPTIKTVVVVPEKPFSFLAGQFAFLTVPGVGEAPFTPSSPPSRKEKTDFTVMKTGKVTEAIHRLKSGDQVGLRGPYGRAYPLKDFEGREVLLVGGGVGLAPLRSLFYALMEQVEKYNRILFCCGAKTPDDYLYKDEVFTEWQSLCACQRLNFRLTVDKKDENWQYQEGVVTCTLDNIDFDVSTAVAAVCGPPIMMKFTTVKLLQLGFRDENIYLSMERKMYCGVGHCRHCLIGTRFVCKDGPVLTFAEIKNEPDAWA
ncbi:MAG: FAD/NAD(P)-binding protein [Candidatus Omnitrophica bacterium]|nr:FAD/NAD(P)-binding protein [Candidatus Omnitrophota bacterium]